MSPWRRLLNRILEVLGYKKTSDRLTFSLDVELIHVLENLAQEQQRSEREVASELLAQALVQRDAAQNNLRRWRGLSLREQQVTALICLGYTNDQIAARLTISPQTVKSHVRNVVSKFGVRTKSELRRSLADWDFSAWRSMRY
jgi:two-component system response regulator NreC